MLELVRIAATDALRNAACRHAPLQHSKKRDAILEIRAEREEERGFLR